MRRCTRCKQLLEDTDFNWKIRDVKRAYYCRRCSRDYIKEHYLKNKRYYLDKARKSRLGIRQKHFKFVESFLRSNPCIDCGEKDVLVLEFDHKDKHKKEFSISDLIKKSVPHERLAEEMSKCEVRCANCHRKKTQKEGSSWRLNCAPVA